jgi:hypothetical protein
MKESLEEFLDNWYGTFKIHPVSSFTKPTICSIGKLYFNKVETFGFMTLCGIDSMDGHTLAEILKNEDPTEILKTELPTRGIERVILNEQSDLKEKTINDVKNSKPNDARNLSHKYCTVNALRKRIQFNEFEDYVGEILKLSNKSIQRYERKLKTEESKGFEVRRPEYIV